MAKDSLNNSFNGSQIYSGNSNFEQIYDTITNSSSMIGVLIYKNISYIVKNEKIIVGRKGNHHKVDIDVGFSNFISRSHLEIFKDYDFSYYIKCIGKNGVFINDTYISKDNDQFQLPNECNIHFPNTEIIIKFKCLPDKDNKESLFNIESMINTNGSLITHNSSSNNNPIECNINNAIVGKNFITEFNNQNNIINGTNISNFSLASNIESLNIPKILNDNIVFNNLYSHIPFLNNGLQLDSNKYKLIELQKEYQTKILKASDLSNINVLNMLDNNYLFGYSHNILNQSKQDKPNLNLNNDNSIKRPHNRKQQLNMKKKRMMDLTKGSDKVNLNNAFNSLKNNKVNPLLPILNQDHNLNSSYKKPPYSYAQLIVQVISEAPQGTLTLSGIYDALSTKFPYFSVSKDKGWQNSVRHNLSLNPFFVKVPRSHDESGKGSYWRLDVSKAPEPETVIEQAYMDKKAIAALHATTNLSMAANNNGVSPTIHIKNFSSKSHLYTSDGSSPTRKNLNNPNSLSFMNFNLATSSNINDLIRDSNNPNLDTLSKNGSNGVNSSNLFPKKRGRPRLKPVTEINVAPSAVSNIVKQLNMSHILESNQDNKKTPGLQTDDASLNDDSINLQNAPPLDLNDENKLAVENIMIPTNESKSQSNAVAVGPKSPPPSASSSSLIQPTYKQNTHQQLPLHPSPMEYTKSGMNPNDEILLVTNSNYLTENDLDDGALMASSLFPETNPLKRAMIEQYKQINDNNDETTKLLKALEYEPITTTLFEEEKANCWPFLPGQTSSTLEDASNLYLLNELPAQGLYVNDDWISDSCSLSSFF